MRPLLTFLLLLGSVLSVCATSITSSSVTNHTSNPSYILELDKSSPLLLANHEHIRSSTEINFTQTGDYRMTTALIRADGSTFMQTTQDFTVSGAVPQAQTKSDDLTPVATTPLDPLETYRVKVTIGRWTGVFYAAQDSFTESTGRRYIHFTTGNAADSSKNVYSELLSAGHGRRWAVTPVTSGDRDKFSFNISYRLHRFDRGNGTLPVSHSINLGYTFQLFDETNTAIGLVTATGSDAVSVPEFDASGLVNAPAVVDGSSTLTFKPSAQLDSVNHTYYVSVVEDEAMKGWTSPLASTTTASVQTSAARLAHYNGTLIFGGTNGLITEPTVSSFGGAPTTSLPVSLTLGATGAYLNGLSAVTLGGTLALQLQPNGNAIYVSTADVTVTAPMPSTGLSAGVSYSRSGFYVDNSGLFADIEVTLPAGVGYIDGASAPETCLYEQTLTAQDQALNSSLTPIGPVTFSPSAGSFFIAEETKPLRYSGSAILWNVGPGSFSLSSPSVVAIRDPLLDYLAGVSSALVNSDKHLKRSNDHLYNSASSGITSLTIGVSAAGAGTITTGLTLGSTDFTTHQPYGTRVVASAGSVAMAADTIDSSVSTLTGVTSIAVGYNQGCESCQSASPPITSITMTPAGNQLRIGPSGALHAAGTTTTTSLAWGYDGTSYAQSVALKSGVSFLPNFLSADTFIKASSSPERGHFWILNTGYTLTGSTLAAQLPETTGYGQGSADYPGLNFRCLNLGDFIATSRLGGTNLSYNLKSNTKYYTRYGGVNGIHDGGSVTASVLIYSYPFDFTNVGLSFIDSGVEESRLNGNIDFPDPAGFTQDFEELKLNCVGDLTELTPTGSSSKILQHWECAFEVVNARFTRSTADSCTPGTGTYVTNIKTWASHIPDALMGDLGIASTGDVVTPSLGLYDGDKLITSRFTLPSSIEIEAALVPGTTGHETWVYSAVQDAYLSHDENGDALTHDGHWNFIGTIDVPFFEDVMLHFHTDCTAGDTSSPLSIMGGWPSTGWHDVNGKTPFEISIFDTAHISHPTGVASAAYRATASGSADYRLRAITSWLDVIDFEYELNWDTTLRAFEAVEIPEQDILVLPLRHQVLHLSPGNIEINFGLQYDLPQINIAQTAFNAIDEATGIAAALEGALGNSVYLAFQAGLDDFEALVGTRIDLTLESALDASVNFAVDDIFAEIEVEFAAGASVDSSQVEAAVHNAFAKGTGVTAKVKSMLSGAASSVSMMKNIQNRLHSVLRALSVFIDADKVQPVASTISVDPNTLASLFDVLNDTYGAKDDTKLQTFAEDIGEQVAAQITAELLEIVWAELMERHGEKIEATGASLAELFDTLLAISTEISGGTGDLFQELQSIIATATAATGQVETAMNQAEADIIAMIQELSSVEISGTVWASLKVELKERFKMAIKDRLFAMSFTADLTAALRNFFDDLQARMTLAIDTGFGTLNDMLLEAIQGFLADVDDKLNDLLGSSLDGIIGSAGVQGYAHINGDTLDVLRLDASFQWNVPEEINFSGGFEIYGYKLLGEVIDGIPAIETPEVRISVPETDLSWLGTDLKANIGCLFSFGDAGGGIPVPSGVGGSFSVDGDINFEAFTITDLGCAVAFGQYNAYFAAELGIEFASYSLHGGAFFGKSNSLDPIRLIDPNVADMLDGTLSSFTGAYVFGEAHMPIIGGSCLLEVSAGVGAGAFYFSDGPTYGGKLFASVRGEALCVVEVEGSVEMIGLKSGATWSYSGEGRIHGEALCAEFDERVRFTWKNKKWDVDY